MENFVTFLKSVSAVKALSKSPYCSSGKSASYGVWTTPAEPAKTLHRVKTSPPASRSFLNHLFKGNNLCTVQYLNKDACGMEGYTHGEASEQTQSENILERKNKMKHLFCKTNTEGIIPTIHTVSSESEEEENVDMLPTRGDKNTDIDLITFTPPSSASTSLSLSTHSLSRLQAFRPLLSTSSILSGESVHSDEYSVTPILGQSSLPHLAPLSFSDRRNRDIVACIRCSVQYLPKLQSSWQRSQTTLASSPSNSFSQRQSALEGGSVQNRTSNTDPVQSSHKAWSPGRTSGQLDDLDDFDSESKELDNQESQVTQSGATAPQDPHSLNDSNKEIACRPTQRISDELSTEDADQCRICHCGDCSQTNPLLTPCLCSGSLQFIHLNCLKKWIQKRIQSGSRLFVVSRCELCMGRLTLDPDAFDLDYYYIINHQEQQ